MTFFMISWGHQYTFMTSCHYIIRMSHNFSLWCHNDIITSLWDNDDLITWLWCHSDFLMTSLHPCNITMMSLHHYDIRMTIITLWCQYVIWQSVCIIYMLHIGLLHIWQYWIVIFDILSVSFCLCIVYKFHPFMESVHLIPLSNNIP